MLPHIASALEIFVRPVSPGEGARPYAWDALMHIVYSAQVSLPLLFIMWRSGSGWDEFGLVRPRYRADIAIAGVCFLTRFAYISIVYRVLELMVPKHLLESSYAFPKPAGFVDLALVPLGSLANAFAEEALMRGFLLPRLERLFGSTWKSVVLTSLIFASYHVYQGVDGFAYAFVTGLVYGTTFATFRRLSPVVLAHAIDGMWSTYAY